MTYPLPGSLPIQPTSQYSNTLLSLDFEKGFDYYTQYALLSGYERATVLINRLTEYASPHMEQMNHLIERLSTSEEFNPRPDPNREDNTRVLEGLITMLGIEIHRTYYEAGLFRPDLNDKLPYEIHAIPNGRIILRERVYPFQPLLPTAITSHRIG